MAQRQLSIPWCSLDCQLSVASILGPYDESLDVNHRRISALESMTLRLFEEWFVRFRFPGSENAPRRDGGEVPIPKGWRFGALQELVDLDPPTPAAVDGPKPFISMARLSTRSSWIDGFELRDASSGARFLDGDVLFARITPCLENGKTGIVRNLPAEHPVAMGSTEFIVIRRKTAGPAFAYALARFPEFRRYAQKSMSGASGRQRASIGALRSYQLALPPESLLGAFERIAWPFLEMVGNIGKSNRSLADARDLLLPRLVNGRPAFLSADRELEGVT